LLFNIDCYEMSLEHVISEPSVGHIFYEFAGMSVLSYIRLV